MSDTNQPIAIALGADNTYAMPLAVTICSILNNVSKKRTLHFYILDGGLSDKSKERLTNLFRHSRNKKHNINLINANQDSINSLPWRGYQSESTYLRLLIPEVLPQHLRKVIYLDCDLILEADITKLWEYNINKTIAWAARSLLIQTLSHPAGVKNYTDYGGNADSPYFNAGVMVINLELWREEVISSKAIDYIQKNRKSIKLNDQEALNAVLIGKWRELDPRWNQQGPVFWPQLLPETGFTDAIMDIYEELKNEPYVIHFLSSSKPWDFKCMHPLTHRFMYYLKQSCWFTKAGWMVWWARLYMKRFSWLFRDLRKALNMIKVQNLQSIQQNNNIS